MSKAQNQSDVVAKAERWATLKKQIAVIDAAREKKLAPVEAKMRAIDVEFDAQIEPIQKKADAFETEVREWLEKQKKSVTVESKSAVVEIVHGTKLADRKADVKRFLKFAKTKGDAVYDCLTVAIAKAKTLIGEAELDKISERGSVPTKTVTLKLK